MITTLVKYLMFMKGMKNNMESKKEVTIKLTMTAEEAQWLCYVMDTPIDKRDHDYDEPPEFLETRLLFARQLSTLNLQ
jgi:hypothetical protein